MRPPAVRIERKLLDCDELWKCAAKSSLRRRKIGFGPGKHTSGVMPVKRGFVDLISFHVMRRLGLAEAFTNDRHFQAAGFVTLF